MAKNGSARSPITINGDEGDAVLASALGVLLQASACANDVAEDSWNFAVEISFLRGLGATDTLFRWLVGKGYVEHRLETTLPGDEDRSFRPSGRFRFAKFSCFILTPVGAEFAQAFLANGRKNHAASGIGAYNGPPARQPVNAQSEFVPGSRATGGNDSPAKLQPEVPVWDPLRRELRVGDQLVKRFKLPSANQETLLMTFEEEGWPIRIDDPLPPRANHNAKTRLHNAIKGLNRHQKRRLIRFTGDGTGEGVLWELISQED